MYGLSRKACDEEGSQDVGSFCGVVREVRRRGRKEGDQEKIAIKERQETEDLSLEYAICKSNQTQGVETERDHITPRSNSCLYPDLGVV